VFTNTDAVALAVSLPIASIVELPLLDSLRFIRADAPAGTRAGLVDGQGDGQGGSHDGQAEDGGGAFQQARRAICRQAVSGVDQPARQGEGQVLQFDRLPAAL